VAFYRPVSDSLFSQQVLEAWQAAASAQGLRWDQSETFAAAAVQPDLRLALISAEAAAPGLDLAQVAAAAPQTHFVVFGAADLQPAQNLTVVHPPAVDQQGFLAGVIAAMLTADWRVGVLSVSDTPAGRAARSAFLNGAAYFCGLCNPFYGPIVDYPVYVELPAASSSAEWQAAAGQLIAQSVKTIYLPPNVNDAGLLTYLADNGVAVITGYAPPAQPGKNHLVSILPDEQALLALPASILGGQAGSQVDLPLTLANVGEKFGLGRQRLAQQTLDDLQAGFIDTGVDPATGEKR